MTQIRRSKQRASCQSCAASLAFGLGLTVLLTVYLSFFAFQSVAFAKSYHVSNLNITATINKDGSMDVTETRTFDFDGSYSWVIQDLSLTGSKGITGIEISEDGKAYTLADSGPGTYSHRQTGNKIEITWRFSANNEAKTFQLSYTVDGAVTTHLDVAELYWKFIGSDWEVPSNNVLVELNLPEAPSLGTNPNDVKAWGHGPISGEVTIVSPQKIVWSVDRLPSGSFLEGRVTFPKELVPQSTNTSGKNALELILKEEQAFASKANRARAGNLAVVVISPLFLIGSVAAAIVLQLRWGKEYKPQFEGDYYRELPADYTPAELGCLWNFGPVGANEISATILDLGRKGYLEIETIEQEEKILGGLLGTKTTTDYVLRLSGKKTATGYDSLKQGANSVLTTHEKSLLDYFFETVSSDGTTLPFEQLKIHAKKSPSSMQGFVQSFKADVNATENSYKFFDHKTKRVQTTEVAAGVFSFIGGIAVVTFTGNILALMITAGGLVLLIGGAFLKRRSQMGSTHLTMWRAFRRFLLDFSALDKAEIPSLIIWEHYLVYAAVLGVAKQVLNQLRIVYPEISQPGVGMYYGWAWMHSSGAAGTASSPVDIIGRMTDTLHTSVSAAVNYRQSSGSGGGGGFSMGGGGGGGGGGGRAG